MKDIFQRKTFCIILVIFLLAVFIYPPFMQIAPQEVVVGRSWGWIFSPPKLDLNFFMELDLKMLLAESIIAILLSIGVCLIPFGKRGAKRN